MNMLWKPVIALQLTRNSGSKSILKQQAPDLPPGSRSGNR
jgi:hypothetical protein